MSIRSGHDSHPCTTPAVLILLTATLCVPAGAAEVVYLDQHWTPELREQFYFTPQGSRLMPYDWFLAHRLSQ